MMLSEPGWPRDLATPNVADGVRRKNWPAPIYAAMALIPLAASSVSAATAAGWDR